jgi:hypothetical protein
LIFRENVAQRSSLFLKEMIKRNEQFKVAYKILSEISVKAYADTFLLSNQVLSKNPLTNCFLSNYVFHKEVNKCAISALIFKLLKYYLKSFVHFTIYVANLLIFRIKGEKYYFPRNLDNLVVINVFFLVDKIKQSRRFVDGYLPGLEDVLKKMNKQFVYVPVFDRYGVSATHGSILQILKNEEVPILCEYQLLRFSDLFYLFYFIIVYPFHVIRCAGDLSEDTYEMGLVKHELLNTIDQVTFYNFSRYLQGRRISRLPYKEIKVISWYENQAGDKNFYKGLRTSPDKVIIYGTQLFSYGEMDLNIFVDENEKRFGVVPDNVIVNGTYYIPDTSKINYRVGPSLRYKKVFEKQFNRDLQNDFLVLLPYAKEYEEHILKFLDNVKMDEGKVIIKTHPASVALRNSAFFKTRYKVVDREIYELFGSAKMVMGAASGSLLEAASIGIPVIVIRPTDILHYDILPEYGKGIIWEEVEKAEDLRRTIEIIEQRLNRGIDAIEKVAKDYRDMFFSKPTENALIKAFDLN